MEPLKLNCPVCWYLGLAAGLGELLLLSGPCCGMSCLAGVFGKRICNVSAKKKIGFGGSSLEVEVCVADRCGFCEGCLLQSGAYLQF